MYAESGAQSKVKGVTSEEVADAVIKSIEGDKAEVDVAPLSLRLGTVLAHVAPATYAKLALKAGSDQQTSQLADGLRHKR
jgi:hypothetical protein